MNEVTPQSQSWLAANCVAKTGSDREAGRRRKGGVIPTLVLAALEGSLRLGFFFLTSSSSSYRYCERGGRGL